MTLLLPCPSLPPPLLSPCCLQSWVLFARLLSAATECCCLPAPHPWGKISENSSPGRAYLLPCLSPGSNVVLHLGSRGTSFPPNTWCFCGWCLLASCSVLPFCILGWALCVQVFRAAGHYCPGKGTQCRGGNHPCLTAGRDTSQWSPQNGGRTECSLWAMRAALYTGQILPIVFSCDVYT